MSELEVVARPFHIIRHRGRVNPTHADTKPALNQGVLLVRAPLSSCRVAPRFFVFASQQTGRVDDRRNQYAHTCYSHRSNSHYWHLQTRWLGGRRITWKIRISSHFLFSRKVYHCFQKRRSNADYGSLFLGNIISLMPIFRRTHTCIWAPLIEDLFSFHYSRCYIQAQYLSTWEAHDEERGKSVPIIRKPSTRWYTEFPILQRARL